MQVEESERSTRRRNVTAERPMTATDRNLAHVNRRAETEPSVDRRLRCVQHRDRLAVIPYVFEVASQQPPGETPAAMRRLHGDDRQTTGWNGVTTGDREVVGVGGSGGDQLAAVVGDDAAVVLQPLLELGFALVTRGDGKHEIDQIPDLGELVWCCRAQRNL